MAIARPVDRRLFFLFDRAHTQLLKAADDHLSRTSQTSAAQAAVMIYLGYHDNCSLGDLAAGIGRQSPAVSGLVSRMERAGLIARKNNLHDRRSKNVQLTPAGWTERENIMNNFRDFNDKLVKNMNQSEIEAVIKFLELSVKNVT